MSKKRIILGERSETGGEGRLVCLQHRGLSSHRVASGRPPRDPGPRTRTRLPSILGAVALSVTFGLAAGRAPAADGAPRWRTGPCCTVIGVDRHRSVITASGVSAHRWIQFAVPRTMLTDIRTGRRFILLPRSREAGNRLECADRHHEVRLISPMTPTDYCLVWRPAVASPRKQLPPRHRQTMSGEIFVSEPSLED